MTTDFSLLDQPWIPVTMAAGRRELIRLADISRPDLVAVSTGRPDCDISLTEFLIGLLAVACPPADDDDWRERFLQPPTADQLQAAFAPLAEALVLDGDGPRFFQDRTELHGEPNEIEALCMDVVAGHFTKPGRVQVLSRAGAAIVLNTLQTSAPAGGAGHRTSLRGGGPLTTLAVPGSKSGQKCLLWRLLWANVPIASEDAPELRRVFPWLVPTRNSDKSGVTTTPADVDMLQAYFGMPRRIRLAFEPNTDNRPCDLFGIVDDVIVTQYVTRPWGTNYEGWSRGHRLSPYYKTKPADAAFLPVHLKSSRIGCREWLGIALGGSDGARLSAQCVTEFRDRVRHRSGDLAIARKGARLLVAGYAMDNMKPLDFGEALMPLVAGSTDVVNQLTRAHAERLIGAAQEASNLLIGAVRQGLYGERGEADASSTVLQPIRDRFWANTEQDFFDTLSTATDRWDALAEQSTDVLHQGHDSVTAEIGKAWVAVLGRHAERIFDDSVPLDDAASDRIIDIVKARRNLLVGLTGYGAVGKRLFAALGLQPPTKASRPSKAEKTRNARTAA